jgi:hypothetical protein
LHRLFPALRSAAERCKAPNSVRKLTLVSQFCRRRACRIFSSFTLASFCADPFASPPHPRGAAMEKTARGRGGYAGNADVPPPAALAVGFVLYVCPPTARPPFPVLLGTRDEHWGEGNRLFVPPSFLRVPPGLRPPMGAQPLPIHVKLRSLAR